MNRRPVDAAGQVLGGYAGDGLLAGGVDGEDDDGVGVSKCTAELVQEIEGARVPMGLEDYVNLRWPHSRAAARVARISVGWWP